MQTADSGKMSSQDGALTGYLELFVGPMFSGKTSKLLEIYKQYKFCNINVAVVNHSADNRYHESMLSTHDRVMIPCIQTNHLIPLWNYSNLDGSFNDECEMHMMLRSADVILINEGQFFDDLYDFIIIAVEYDKKHVVVGGLDGDCFRKPFGQILQLIPLADRVTKLTSLCKICADGTIGLFSYRNSDSKETVEVGGSEKYMPLCRKHYLTCSGQQVRTVGLPTIRVTLECHPKVCLP